MLEPRCALRNLAAYRPPLAGRQGLRLDFNESAVGCSPRVLECLRQLDSEVLSRYPEREPVEAQVAQFFGLDPAQVLLTNGVDEAIHLLCDAYLSADTEALTVIPSFGMYRLYAEATGAHVIAVPAAQDFAFPAAELLQRISPRVRLIAIANPNNPTGAVASRHDLLRIIEAAPHAAVLVDEAYFEFYGHTLLDAVGRRPNLFVARTFSKAYGLAGLRAGMLAGDVAQMDVVRRTASPYNVNAIALACVLEGLRDQEYVNSYIAEVRRNAARLERELAGLGLPYWPSQANFMLVHAGERPRQFVEALRSRGILVRDRSADAGCEGCVRITIGTDAQTTQLITVLREVAPQFVAKQGASA